MILQVETVSSIDDIVVGYVNHLLERHAMDQHMLANQEPPDDRLTKHMEALRSRNTELEILNRDLRARIAELEDKAQAMRQTIEHQRSILDGKN